MADSIFWTPLQASMMASLAAASNRQTELRAQLARAEKAIAAAHKYINNEKHYDEFVSAVIEYDRPSAPLDAPDV